MRQYADEEELHATKLLKITKDVHELLRKERNRLRKEGRRVSMSKLACNAIITAYGKSYFIN